MFMDEDDHNGRPVKVIAQMNPRQLSTCVLAPTRVRMMNSFDSSMLDRFLSPQPTIKAAIKKRMRRMFMKTRAKILPPIGEVAEWSIVPDSKSGVLQGTEGSNPSLSASNFGKTGL